MHFQSDLTLSMGIEQPVRRVEPMMLPVEGEHATPNPVPPLSSTVAPNIITLDIPATLAYVHILSRCACALVESVANLAEPAVNLYNLELAVQEVAVNIVKHAYAHSAGRIQMTLCLEAQPARLTILLQDTGASFDPARVPPPKLGELQEHGFGLFLVRQLMDEVEYSYSAKGNRWKLVKTIPTEKMPTEKMPTEE